MDVHVGRRRKIRGNAEAGMPGRQTAGPAELQRPSARAHRRKRVWHMTSDLVLPDNKERSIAAWDSVQSGAMEKPSGADSRDGLRHREPGLVPKHDASVA